MSHNFARSEGWPLSRGLKMVRRKPKVALLNLLEIRTWANTCSFDIRNHILGRSTLSWAPHCDFWPLQALAYVRAAADCRSPAAAPVTQLPAFHGQPTSPQPLENSSSTLLLILRTLFLHRPTRLAGSADTRWPAATAADPEKRSWPSTSINFAGSEACRALRRAKVGRK